MRDEWPGAIRPRQAPGVRLAACAGFLVPFLPLVSLLGCSGAPPARRALAPVAARSAAEGRRAARQGGRGGQEHAAALEQLHVATLGWRDDRQGSVASSCPTRAHWTRVKFWGVKSLVGFRYGKDHHAIVGGFVIHVDDDDARARAARRSSSGRSRTSTRSRWSSTTTRRGPSPWNGKIVDIDSLVASTATLGVHDEYAVAYATYPAWTGACLVLGVAVPARDELERAKAVRDRFATEILPHVKVMSQEEPKERY